MGQEESYFSSEIHDGEGIASGALAVIEEAYCRACYISTNQEAKTDRKWGQALNTPRDGLLPARLYFPKFPQLPKQNRHLGTTH